MALDVGMKAPNTYNWQSYIYLRNRKDETMQFEDLSPELQEKARACKSGEELVALAQAEGIELSDDQLEAVVGGAFWDCSGNYCDGYICTRYNGHD